MHGASPEEDRLSNTQTKEKDKKVRVFELAKELALGSKDLVAMAKELGFAAVTNQLSGLSPDQVDALKARARIDAGLRKGGGAAVLAAVVLHEDKVPKF